MYMKSKKIGILPIKKINSILNVIIFPIIRLWCGYTYRAVQHARELVNLRGTGVILRPYPDELLEVMGAEDARVPGEVVEVVHDDSHK